MSGNKRQGYIKYLLYVAVVSIVATSFTLARYSESLSARAIGIIAAVNSDTVTEFEVTLDDLIAPGDSREIRLNVVNFNDNIVNDVVMDYSLKVETTGNLPLLFTVSGEKDPSDENDMSILVGGFDENMVASGGSLPFGESVTHEYTITVTWDAQINDEGYMHEIDMLTVKVDTTQKPPQ